MSNMTFGKGWAIAIGALALVVAGCGGGGDSATGATNTGISTTGSTGTATSTSGNWATLVDFALTPQALHAPVSATEIQEFKLDYYIDHHPELNYPFYTAIGHLLRKGETLLSPDAMVGRVFSRPCGWTAAPCGQPTETLCSYSAGWLNLANRRVICNPMSEALEVPPGEYQFVASVCYADATGTRVCSTKYVPMVLE